MPAGAAYTIRLTGHISRFNASAERTVWYYSELSVAFARLLPGSLSDELALSVAELRRLAG